MWVLKVAGRLALYAAAAVIVILGIVDLVAMVA